MESENSISKGSPPSLTSLSSFTVTLIVKGPHSMNKDSPMKKWNLSPSLPPTNFPRLHWTVYRKSHLSPQCDDPEKLQFNVARILVYCQIPLGDEQVSVCYMVQC